MKDRIVTYAILAGALLSAGFELADALVEFLYKLKALLP